MLEKPSNVGLALLKKVMLKVGGGELHSVVVFFLVNVSQELAVVRVVRVSSLLECFDLELLLLVEQHPLVCL